ncbi:DNA topoisomerase-1 [Stella humosa]|uniref:DNA topoisomerase-1 n=1 Tax=Stella humosa TaxID=94 RepID=A0A3N1KPY8_9PROT|nr:DNA topoisomerase IB [Stella humosa]ROP83853.1 DNA topoisomerase-1 [Stella humosa]BBK32885.1 hypothetical protein STHU_35190 [Stella humosa]
MPRDGDILPEAVVEALEGSGLVHSSDDEPGIARRRRGRGFAYLRPDGSPIKDARTLARIRALAIPPAYRSVWICPRGDGHLQATGRDARGRKQYRYHPDWRQVRDQAKFGRMAAFGRALPAIRAQVAADLARPELTKAKVVAGVVRLLERTLIRVGNDRYAAENGSFGLTTLRKRHAAVAGDRIGLEFRAKGGRLHATELADRRIARLVAACRELPGQRLFQYLDDDGQRHPVGSEDVNLYLKEATGQDFSAKDFRTWAGTLLAACHLADAERGLSQTAARRIVMDCVRGVAAKLANTPAVCRKCYIHPGVLDAYVEGRLPRRCADEKAMLRLLGRLARAQA